MNICIATTFRRAITSKTEFLSQARPNALCDRSQFAIRFADAKQTSLRPKISYVFER
ncbi:hypothetical protein SAMN04488005_2007 [Yoonia tamlensis]|uniref:Uncharacterized protein n=1 Tax=Yoonia tamlensis TaxID=390270 RepID=A0A1I6GPS7_9RHOB|nr:hypothetical protein SAMN04488005_2007 [Yoonia tamlensis]